MLSSSMIRCILSAIQDPNGSLRASADTERRIDSEVVSVLKDAYSRVTALLVRLAGNAPIAFRKASLSERPSAALFATDPTRHVA